MNILFLPKTIKQINQIIKNETSKFNFMKFIIYLILTIILVLGILIISNIKSLAAHKSNIKSQCPNFDSPEKSKLENFKNLIDYYFTKDNYAINHKIDRTFQLNKCIEYTNNILFKIYEQELKENSNNIKPVSFFIANFGLQKIKKEIIVKEEEKISDVFIDFLINIQWKFKSKENKNDFFEFILPIYGKIIIFIYNELIITTEIEETVKKTGSLPKKIEKELEIKIKKYLEYSFKQETFQRITNRII